jgi:signal peptidase I
MADTPLPPHFTSSTDPAGAPAPDGMVPSGVNGVVTRPAGRDRDRRLPEPGQPTFAQWAAAMAVYAAILAGVWVVAAIALTLYRVHFLNVIGFATLFTAVAAFFIRTLFPLSHEKAQAAAAEKQQPHTTDSFREIIDTVVFVVVLVLMLKSFSAEAFVIPTGSMAPTLLGYNKLVKCPECGEEFPVNCSNQVDPTDRPATYVGECYCPNCRKHIAFIPPPEWMDRANKPQGAEIAIIPDPGWSSGDRVLVAKFVYDLFGKTPERLDVVVFKYPGDAKSFPRDSGPVRKHVPMNYIKRLIGLPGETIAISRGKIFVLRADKGLRYDDFEKVQHDPNELARLWERDTSRPDGDFTHSNDPKATDLFKAGKFEIIRKNPEVLLAMLRLVYDNDHQARDLKGPDFQRWVFTENSGWAASGATDFVTAFSHNGGSSEDAKWLRYRHVLRDSDGKPQLITDFTGYNTSEGGRRGDPGNWASDLAVECQAKVEKAEGTLILELSRGPDRFQASVDLAKQTCTLFRINSDDKKTVELATNPSLIKGKGTYHLRFANVDDRLTVWVDDKLVFGDGVEYVCPKRLRPVKENDLEQPVSIGSRGAKVVVSKLKVWRDVYYTTMLDNNPEKADLDIIAGNPENWEKIEEFPVSTYYVQPDHFLCMGDNSPASSDSRSWGLVPRRLLLGKALLVYYPFNRAGRIR